MMNIDQDVIRGDRFSSEIYQIVDSGDAPIDLTNWTFTSHVKVSFADTNPVFTFTVEKTDATNGMARLTCQPADTEGVLLDHDLVQFPLIYDVEMVNDADATEKYTPIGGKVRLWNDVTR